MVAVPLGGKFSKRNDAFVPSGRLLNLYAEQETSGLSPDGTLRIQRPGLSPSKTLGVSVRGVAYRTVGGQELVVSGNTLFANGASKGTIGGVGISPITTTTFTAAIIGGTTLYLYNTTVSALALPDGYLAQDVDQLNQYVLVLTSTGRFYWIVPGATTLDPLDFATAESSGDGGVALKRVNDEFWIFGTDTTEVWQSTGDLDAPFQRVSGRLYERGCLDRDTVQRFDNTLMWVSDDGQVCRGGAVPQVVSDNSLAERIRNRTDSLSAWTFSADGHDFYVLYIPGQGSFAYDALTQTWSEFGSYGKVGWLPKVGYTVGGDTYCAGPDSGKVWLVDVTNGTDDGQPIERIVTGLASFIGKTGRNDSLSVGVGSSADTVIRLRWRDGQEDFPNFYETLPIRAPFDVASIYRLGRPQQPYRQVEYSCLAPERIRFAGCVANESFQ